MSENEELTIEQLTEYVESFYSQQGEDHQDINQILTNWVQSPSSITTAFEIIQSSKNKKLRFIAACCFHYFIKYNSHLFSEDNLLEMANLFGSFIMENQNRIDSEDTSNILVSLAELCGIIPQFIEESLKMFPPEIFLILIGNLTEEICDQYFRSKFDMYNQIDKIIEELRDTIYQYFLDTPFNIHWAKSFYQFFKHFGKPIYCIPFFDKIEMMTQNQDYFNFFEKIFSEAFDLSYDDDGSAFEFNTQIAQIGVPFAVNNPDHAAIIWNSMFKSTDYTFFLSEDRVEFTEPIIESFYQSIPAFYDDDTFLQTIQSFIELISTIDPLAKYPDELWIKHICAFIELLIDLYNEKRDEKMDKCIKFINSFNSQKSKYFEQIKEFIISHPLNPALFLIYCTQLFSYDNDNELRAQIISQTFELVEIPYEALSFLKKYFHELKSNESYVQRFIQLNMDILESNADESTNTLRYLSSYYNEVLIPLKYDLSTSLFPIIPELNFSNQLNLILMFLNILSEDDLDKFEIIQNHLLQYCSSAVMTSDIKVVDIAINKMKDLYTDYMPKEDFAASHDFMRKLLPLVFHEFAPAASAEDNNIQDSLSDLILHAVNSKCVDFPETEDEDERRTLLIESDMYSEIFQWLFTMMNQSLCAGHFVVLKSFMIQPFPEILNVISIIEPNENNRTIQEMIAYVRDTCNKDSNKIFSIIPISFFFSFFSSNMSGVVCCVIKFFRDIKNITNDVKQLIMQEIIQNSVTENWIKIDDIINESIKTLASLVAGDQEVFEIYVGLMTSFFDPLDPNRIYFEKLWEYSQLKPEKIENITKMAHLNDVKADLRNIIYSHQS